MDCIDRRWEGAGVHFDQALAEMAAQEGLPPYRVVVGSGLRLERCRRDNRRRN